MARDELPPEVSDGAGVGLRTRAIRGAGWTVGTHAVLQVFRLASNIALASLLGPAVFGLVAITSVIRRGIDMFSDVGIEPSIVHNPRGEQDEFLQTAFLFKICRGVAVFFVTCAIAYPAAEHFARNDPGARQLLWLIPASGFSAAVMGLQSPAIHVLARRLQFEKIAILRLGMRVVGILATLSWAILSPSAWAIIGGGLIACAAEAVATYFVRPQSNVRPRYHRSCASELLSFGSWVFLSTAMAFVATSLDRLVLGSLLTLSELGVYSIVLGLGLTLLQVLEQVASRVLFPVLARFRDRPDILAMRGEEARLTFYEIGAACVAAFIVLAPEFFDLFYDERYAGAGRLAPWVGIFVWTSMLSVPIVPMLLAEGNSKVLFLAKLAQATGLVFGLSLFHWAGVEGFLLGMAAGPWIALLVMLRGAPVRVSRCMREIAGFSVLVGGWVASAAGIVHVVGDVGELGVSLMFGIMPIAVAAGRRMPWAVLRHGK